MSRVRVKICGITSAEDARTAALLGADALGLNFYSGSPRYIAPHVARDILRELPPFVEPVALYVNEPLRVVFASLNDLPRVRTFQWHGSKPELCDAYPFQMIVAAAVRDRGSLTEIDRYLSLAKSLGKMPSAVLVDAHVPGMHGGTGQRAPWELLADWRPSLPLILAGGLTPDNVAEAIRLVRPYAVDVASGVESAPGKKDAERMKRFLESVREAEAG